MCFDFVIRTGRVVSIEKCRHDLGCPPKSSPNGVEAFSQGRSSNFVNVPDNCGALIHHDCSKRALWDILSIEQIRTVACYDNLRDFASFHQTSEQHSSGSGMDTGFVF